MEKERTRRSYTAEFKLDAVKLVVERGRKATEVAKGLGVNENVFYRWINQYKTDPEKAFPGNGNMRVEDAELRQLRRELEDVKEERDILKKVVSIFSKTGR